MTFRKYRVSWEIDVEATTATSAAREAARQFDDWKVFVVEDLTTEKQRLITLRGNRLRATVAKLWKR